jgi:hypothetical protein
MLLIIPLYICMSMDTNLEQAFYYKKSERRSPSAETRWRTCEEAFAAAAGPKRREALATGAKHGKLDTEFYTFFIRESRDSFSRLKPIFIGTSMLSTISTTNGQVDRMSPI